MAKTVRTPCYKQNNHTPVKFGGMLKGDTCPNRGSLRIISRGKRPVDHVKTNAGMMWKGAKP